MQTFLDKIKTSFKQISLKKVSYKKKSIRPGKHWRIILVTSQIIIIVLGFIAYYFYNEINNGRFFVVDNEPVESEIKINTELLKKIVSNLTSKEEVLSEIIIGKIVPPDPSL